MGFSFEYLMWVMTRISGLALMLLALFGMAVALWMGARSQMDLGTLLRWTFFPNPNHVVNSNIPELEPAWSNAYWQIMQMLVVFFGATHGFNGLRVVIEDYTDSATWLRPLLRGLIFLLWIFVLIISVMVILAS
jgi:succinate dehydrogenase hydrophobic anchor subunit